MIGDARAEKWRYEGVHHLKDILMFPQIEAFLIRRTTGCSCCRNENELRGPFRTVQAASQQAQVYERWPLLSSQYAPRRHYRRRSREPLAS
jgi:hypothetical protein